MTTTECVIILNDVVPNVTYCTVYVQKPQTTQFRRSVILKNHLKILFHTVNVYNWRIFHLFNYTLLENLTDDAIAWPSVTKLSTISLYLTKLYVTYSFAIAS